MRRTGTVSLPTFYARRARRLLPASALVLLVTVVASFFMMPPLRVPDVAGDAAAAALYVSNIRFALQATDYLQAELAPSPILHFWSLGVEEQFYIFWPAIVLLVARGGGDAARRIGVVAGFIAVGSFLLSLYLTQANQPWAFFSLPTRAWELGLGAFLAIGAAQLARIPARPAAVLAWVGLAMVALSGVVLSTGTPFPGDRGAAAHRWERPGDRGRLPPGPVRAGTLALDGDPALPRAGSRTRSTCGTGHC